MSEFIRRFKLMNKKYLAITAISLLVAMIVARFVLSDLPYAIACGAMGISGAWLYHKLVRG